MPLHNKHRHVSRFYSLEFSAKLPLFLLSGMSVGKKSLHTAENTQDWQNTWFHASNFQCPCTYFVLPFLQEKTIKREMRLLLLKQRKKSVHYIKHLHILWTWDIHCNSNIAYSDKILSSQFLIPFYNLLSRPSTQNSRTWKSISHHTTQHTGIHIIRIHQSSSLLSTAH